MKRRLIVLPAIMLSLLLSISTSLFASTIIDNREWQQVGGYTQSCDAITGDCGNGWTWASHQETVELVNNVLNVNFDGVIPLYTDAAHWFDLFYPTGAEAGAVFTFAYSRDTLTPYIDLYPDHPSYNFNVGAIVVDSYYSCTLCAHPEYGSVSLGFDPDVLHGGGALYGATSFLYRDVALPIPAALFMFAPALLGLLGFRRKLRA